MNEIIYENLKKVARKRDLITYTKLNDELKLGLNYDKEEDRLAHGLTQ